jgi:murein DD-endopeptidase MepM/ murein hydrolase activator NlpD
MRLIDPPDGRPWALLVLCGGSLLLNVVLASRLWMAEPITDMVQPVDDVATAAEAVSPDVAQAAAEVPAAPTEATEVVEAVAVVPADEGLFRVHAPVTHSLARTFQNAAGEHADVVSAVYARLFVWDLDLRRDLQRGDEVAVAYEWDGELAHIPVASYHSNKLRKTLRAYRFTATGDTYASWWNEDGVEAARRLKAGPLHNYEQVTSLLKDRPTHKGMDFKVPVGADVVSPKAGTVVRTDWNWTYNGNCAEVKYDDGTLARFLHLSETTVKAGQRLSANAVVGLSGNTGRSTAPHLHYELEKNGKVVDPVKYHGVEQRKLGAADMQAFEGERDRLEAQLNLQG